MRWMIQSVSLLVMLILGIFLGVDSAEKNMQKMQGTEGAPRAVQVTPTDGKVQIQVLGKDVILNKNDSLFEDPSSSPSESSTPTPAPESEKPKAQSSSSPQPNADAAMSGGSSLAQFGNELGGGLKTTTRKVLDFMFGWTSNGANQSEPHIQGSDSGTTPP
ncbi:DUF3679 domain-containing protein [Thermoactinomyces sp. DSM 45892]|uniref:DUF3679 domain-containing protein n=1 Tax=Thermoactinomyces sp. DSM 45892 TaxID=1882753 RepID=UPI000898CEC8|nr:DUF3679 domain-containing protein [Thermoactinomyces sp. DSM 45892]SDY66224.1 Protein of unknown function [Thermoactinomyces sp. DSM 45892]